MTATSGALRAAEAPRDTLGSLVAAEIRAAMARRRITGEAVSAALGKSRGYVSRRLIGETCVDLDDLQAFTSAIGVSVESVLEPAIAELHRQQSAISAAETPDAAPGKQFGMSQRSTW